jgi:hypothetical protein
MMLFLHHAGACGRSEKTCWGHTQALLKLWPCCVTMTMTMFVCVRACLL